jgi:hypothetical protein
MSEATVYRSPLRVLTQAPSFVTYVDALSGEKIGKVYQREGKWYLTATYTEWQTLEVFAKYEGFLLLSNLHKNRP